jgi:hypothetical protein
MARHIGGSHDIDEKTCRTDVFKRKIQMNGNGIQSSDTFGMVGKLESGIRGVPNVKFS